MMTEAHVDPRCWWSGTDPEYVAYHDTEWGFPVDDDRRLYEKIVLEGFQAGLSWLTILRKRENFRRAFAEFDAPRVAAFTAKDIKRLLNDAGIVRHRGKIESAINNAQRVLEIVETHGSLAALIWRYEPPADERPKRVDRAALETMAKTPTSTRLSKDLKKLGFSFVGPTTAYAFMQSMGLVNDHLEGCPVRQQVETARRAFTSPAD